MLIPHSERRTYNLQLSVFTLLAAGTLLVVVLCAFLILSTHFTTTNERMAAVNRSLAASELALESVGDEVIALQGTMQEFRVLIDQLQRILSSGNLTASTASAARGAGDLAAFVGQPSALAAESPGVAALRQLSAALDAAMMPLTELNETVAAQQTLLADVPTLWPVRGGGYVSFEFGPQRHPFTGAFYIHRGIDIAMHRGAEIVRHGQWDRQPDRLRALQSGQRDRDSPQIRFRHPLRAPGTGADRAWPDGAAWSDDRNDGLYRPVDRAACALRGEHRRTTPQP